MSDEIKPPRAYQRLFWTPNQNTQEDVLLSLCPDCGSVVGDQKGHDAWHLKVGAASMGFGGLVGL